MAIAPTDAAAKPPAAGASIASRFGEITTCSRAILAAEQPDVVRLPAGSRTSVEIRPNPDPEAIDLVRHHDYVIERMTRGDWRAMRWLSSMSRSSSSPRCDVVRARSDASRSGILVAHRRESVSGRAGWRPPDLGRMMALDAITATAAVVAGGR
jgi:hypothetical protein